MKRLFIIISIILSLTVIAFADFNQFQETPLPGAGGGTGTGIVTSTNCNQAQYYPVVAPLCKDSNTNLIYTGTGTGVVQVGGGTGCTGNLCAITASTNVLSLIEAANYAAIKTLLSYYTSSDVGVTIEGYDSTILKSASIGSTVQAHNATLDAISALANSSGQLTNDGSGNFSYTSGGGTILGSLAASEYVIPMENGTANTLTLSQWSTDNAGDLLLPTGASIKINGSAVLSFKSNGNYYLSLYNNTSYTPVSGQYRYLFLNGVPKVDVNGMASAICLAGGTCSGYQASGGIGLTEQIVAIFDGGGSAIPLNSIAYVHRDYAISSINEWTVTCNAEDATPIVIDVYGQAYSASSLPASTLCSTGTKPTGGGASAYGNQAAWNCSTTSSAANYDYAFKVITAPSTSTWCVVTLKVTR